MMSRVSDLKRPKAPNRRARSWNGSQPCWESRHGSARPFRPIPVWPPAGADVFPDYEPGTRRVVEGVIEAYRTGRVRLWLTNFADAPDLVEELGQWAGVVRIDAEAHARRWEPDWRDLSGRLAGRRAEGDPPGFDDAVMELLPLAREEFGRVLESKQVPRKVAEKAKSLFSITPPVQQWKM